MLRCAIARVLAGLDRDFDGEFLLDGFARRGPSPRVGVIFQESRLLPWLRLPPAQGKAATLAWPACSTKLVTRRHGPGAAHAAGGMAQRVALARGLLPAAGSVPARRGRKAPSTR
jgi:sulfonate transport system ATP-binding protein